MERTHIFDQIETGMPVLTESDKDEVGTVEYIRYGEGSGDAELPNVDIIAKTFKDIFDPKTDYPQEVYEKLYAEGFIQVDRGLQSDVYVLPSQIVHVVDGEVHINVDEDQLLEE